MRIFLLFVHLFNTLKPHHAALAKERVRFNLYMYIKNRTAFCRYVRLPPTQRWICGISVGLKNESAYFQALSAFWWRYGDSNPGPVTCEATALPTELYPRLLKHRNTLCVPVLVAENGLEPSTLRVWTACSSQLSYSAVLCATTAATLNIILYISLFVNTFFQKN